MTKREAIDILQAILGIIEWEYPMDYAVAIDMAVKALKGTNGSQEALKEKDWNALKAGIQEIKKTMKSSNRDYATGYLCALSAVEGMMACIADIPEKPQEIIHCKDCIHSQEDKIFGGYWCNGDTVPAHHFCGFAERRKA